MNSISSHPAHLTPSGLQAWQAPRLVCFGAVQDLTAGGTALAKEVEWCPTPDLGCYPHYQRP